MWEAEGWKLAGSDGASNSNQTLTVTMATVIRIHFQKLNLAKESTCPTLTLLHTPSPLSPTPNITEDGRHRDLKPEGKESVYESAPSATAPPHLSGGIGINFLLASFLLVTIKPRQMPFDVTFLVLTKQQGLF